MFFFTPSLSIAFQNSIHSQQKSCQVQVTCLSKGSQAAGRSVTQISPLTSFPSVTKTLQNLSWVFWRQTWIFMGGYERENTYLIFVTYEICGENLSCGEISDFYTWQMWGNLKFLHMWRSFKFLYTTTVEKSEMSPHLACDVENWILKVKKAFTLKSCTNYLLT